MDGWMDESMNGWDRWIDRWMDGWIRAWMGGWDSGIVCVDLI